MIGEGVPRPRQGQDLGNSYPSRILFEAGFIFYPKFENRMLLTATSLKSELTDAVFKNDHLGN